MRFSEIQYYSFQIFDRFTDVSINEEAEGGFDEGGITAGSFVDWAVGEMRFAMKPGADAAIALDCVLWAESSSETHPAHAHYKYRTQQMEEALTAMIQSFVDEEGAEIGTTPRGSWQEIPACD